MHERLDAMCGCKDRACADKVQEATDAWLMRKAKEAGDSGSKPNETQMKRMQELGTRYGECKARAMSGYATDEPGSYVPGSASKVANADQIIKQTYEQLGRFTVAELELSYVRADGTLHPTHGKAEIRLGKPRKGPPPDDPNREIGAPVPVEPTESEIRRCPNYVWKDGTRSDTESHCMAFGEIQRPQCSVLEVWKQAIEAGAPAAGLATLTLNPVGPGRGTQAWSFRIDDGPRDIHFSHDVPDVCDPTLEKPTPMIPKQPNPY